jgi:hypothetical protein
MTITEFSDQVPKNIENIITQQVNKLEHNLSSVDLADKMMSTYSSLHRQLRKTNTSSLSSQTFSVLDCCRIYFLLQCKQKFPSLFISSLIKLIKLADDEEKISISKGLCFLDNSGELLELIIDLCRTNTVDLLTAIAIRNPYPSTFFSQESFNQMVLKLLFCQQNIILVVGLSERKNSSLSRMASDYKQERINANRSIPLNIELII